MTKLSSSESLKYVLRVQITGSLRVLAQELPLYGSGGLRFLWDTKFDQAMVAFLDCLQQFKEEVERSNGFSLPYR